MKSITLTLMIIAFAGIANAQTECNSEFKAVAGIQDIGDGQMSPILGFNYNLFAKNNFGGFIEAKHLNAETVCWIGGAYKTNFHEEFSQKEFESKIGVGTRTDSTTELFLGAEAKIQFAYFIFSASGELSMEKVEYGFIAQYAMCPNLTYFGIAADSRNGYGFRATQLLNIKSGSILYINCGVMSNNFHTMKSDGFGFTDLDPMIHMMIGIEF